MAQRRLKSLMHGSAPDTRVYHHEHRSRKGRSELYRYDRESRIIDRSFRLKREKKQRKFKRKF